MITIDYKRLRKRCRVCMTRRVHREVHEMCNQCYSKATPIAPEPPPFIMEPTPWEPTTAAPGTPEKMEVLARRARARQPLFHPQDARGV